MDMLNEKLEMLNSIHENVIELINNYSLSYGLRVSINRLLREIDIYKKCDTEKAIKDKSKSKIQIGGGARYLEDFFNIDINMPADMICDVRDGIPLDSNSANFIFCEHFIEHIDYPVSVELFLTECLRILCPGGSLVVGAPDANIPILAFTDGNIEYYDSTKERWERKKDALIESYIDIINYHFRDAFNHPKYTEHLWAYNEDKLVKMLLNHGFSSAKAWEPDLKIANSERIDRTVYVAGTK